MTVENNRDYFKVEFAAGAASTFTTAVQFPLKYDRLFVRRQTMASVSTIYPQVSIDGTNYFRVLKPTDNAYIQSAATSILALGTSVSGYFIELDGLGNYPYLRFEAASLPTLAVNMDVLVAKKEY